MKKRQIVIGFLVLVSIVGLARAADLPYKEGEVLVRFANPNIDKSTKNSILDSIFGCSCSPVAKEYSIVPGLTLVKLPAGVTVEAAQSSLNQSPDILYAEPNYKRQLAAIPNDQRFGELWGMHNTGQTGGTAGADVNAPEAWEIHTGGSDIIVAVTDTGVDYNHPDLMGNMWVNTAELNGTPGVDDDGNGYIDDIYGYDFGDNDGDPMDDAPGIAGHGTHVSGTIGAVGNNGIGVSGVCWDVGIMACKIADANGTLLDSAIISSIEYATSNGADVINASWGGYYYSQADYDVIQAAGDAGVLFVAAAHNYSSDNDVFPLYPASYNLGNIISVMATNHDDNTSNYSNYGAVSVDLAAPGGEMFFPGDDRGILSTVPGGYDFYQGTSMACPHVAGACALMWSADPSLSYVEIKDLLLLTVDKISALGGLCVTEGRLNLHTAVENVVSDTLAPTPDPAEWSVIKSVVIGEPKETGRFTIVMEAQEATDKSEVQYYFEEISGEPNSGWQDERVCIFTGLDENTPYTFHVKVRDLSENFNETGWSDPCSALTDVGADTSSPWPDPSQWAMEPRKFATGIIGMEAKTSYDESGPVQYRFNCTSDPCLSSGWQESPTYMKSPLGYGTYTFTVDACDTGGYATTASTPPVTVILAAPPVTLEVPSALYPTIQSAIDDAHPSRGDTVLVHTGTYSGNDNRDLDFLGKAITVRSENPENLGIVATTIIDCGGTGSGSSSDSHRAFDFHHGEGTDSVVAGFTIINGYIRVDGPNGVGPGASGTDGQDSFGGAILCQSSSSPTIRNCVIRDCVAEGGHGGDGQDGDPTANDPNIPNGGAGGDAGTAYGGGISCIGNSDPIIDKCTITDCSAIGGDGGDGGDGVDEDTTDPCESLWIPVGDGNDGGDGGWAYSGGIDCDTGSNAIITNCIVSDNNAVSGFGGSGGLGGSPGGGDGSGGSNGFAYVGGIYLGANYVGTMENTRVSGNEGENGVGGIWSDISSSLTLNNCDILDNTALSGPAGGIYFSSGATPNLNNCRVEGNKAGSSGRGGGIYCSQFMGTGVTINVNNSSFSDNESKYGGGIYLSSHGTLLMNNSSLSGNIATRDGGGMCLVETDFTIDKSTIGPDNSAVYGGGLYWVNSDANITNCTINGNFAEGQAYCSGAGMYCDDSNAIIKDCLITGNEADGSGGAMSVVGPPLLGGEQQIINCLITDNISILDGGDGGGLSSSAGALSEVRNCTIVGNWVVGFYSSGGGVSCYDAFVGVVDSILWNNGADYGGQIAIGDPLEPDNPASTVMLHYSDIMNGADGVFVGDSFDPWEGPWLYLPTPASVIEDDPLFVATSETESNNNYYLSQVAAGQLQNSPCVDTGSDDANDPDIGMDLYTTRTDWGIDSNKVDMGYHYNIGMSVPKYQLRIEVVDNGSGPHGSLFAIGSGSDPFIIGDPNSRMVQQGTLVDLLADPDPNYRVKVWTGTDDDGSASNNNTVIMDRNRTVYVEFKRGVIRLYVPGEYPTIADAVVAAGNGDIIILSKDTTYFISDTDGIDFGGKSIILQSEDPNDPAIVASTIIDCQGDRYVPRRAFWFHNGEDANAVITGVTIVNGYTVGAFGAHAAIPGTPWPPDQSPDAPPRANSGMDASGDGYGGAILCENGSSPTIENCVIRNCIVTGGQGGDGANSYYVPIGDDTDGQSGGHGGDGEGNGYGGAIACLDGSSPIIRNCTIKDNFARGGCGGDGGDGSIMDGTGRESWGGNGGDALGDGKGGAIYCDGGSNPVITDCNFNGGVATQGIVGLGGQSGGGSNWPDPWDEATDGFDGITESYGGIAGGAAYFDEDSDANFNNCTFTGNKACEYQPITFYYTEAVPVYSYTRGGALYSAADNAVFVNDCNFTANLGGAVYCETGCVLDFNDCLFEDNSYRSEYPPEFLVGGGPVDFGIINPDLIYFYLQFGIDLGFIIDSNGGAIHINPNSDVSIVDCTFSGNFAYTDGGALYCESDVDITNCSFSGNEAGNNGGAVEAYLDTGNPATKIVLTLNFEDCSFAGNNASVWGGGVYFKDIIADFNDCYFVQNTAQSGGGLFVSSSEVTMTGGVIQQNKSTGGDGLEMGGGLACIDSDATIMDVTIGGNRAEGNDGGGGAINFYGGFVTHKLKNCLFTNNYANTGGAVSCSLVAIPDIDNCTFSDNYAGSMGGAVFSETGALPSMSDCIFTGSTKHAIYEKDGGGNAEVKFSLFYGNAGGDYYDSGTGLTYTGAGEIGSIPGGSFNLYGDPLFASGALGGFYLNQSFSPAVDEGSDTAANLGLDSYTTDPCNAFDMGDVDIGYHYRVSSTLAQFQLTVAVAGGQGTIEPQFGTYYAGTVVKLTATPGAGYLIAGWFGTVNDNSESTINYVVMNSHKDVWVEFKQPNTLRVGGPGYYSDIQDALFDAEDGDTIVVYTGTYYGPTIWVNKSVIIQSEHPDDPSYVAATILDGTGYGNPGIVFRYGTSTVLNGFTLQNFRWGTYDGEDGDRGEDHPNGEDGGWSVGSAIFISAKAGPTIKNCVIRDNWIQGGDGGNGEDATSTANAGRGGWGAAALGGAVYCGWYSSPTFINCRILDNTARGGNGGDGGDWHATSGNQANYGGNWSRAGEWYIPPDTTGAQWSIGDLYEVFQADPWAGGWELAWFWQEAFLWYYDWNDPDTWMRPGTGYLRDYRWYSAYGGGVFCQEYSNVSFMDCVIRGNLAQGGMSGEGGERPGENPEPEYSYELPTFGGGVYCAANSKVTFTGCTLGENVATEPELADMNDPASGQRYRLNPYVGHGGGICAENTATIEIIDCNFVGNEAQVGGGMHWADANAVIVDSSFMYNTAYHGGGMSGEHGLATILGCEITNNNAVNSDVNVVVIGEGGGIHFGAMEADIFDCSISNNQADGAGGGVYFSGENTPILHNCLITGNISGRDGGGVSANIFAQPTIFNCTIADNAVTGEGFEAAYGGGLSCSYGSSTEVINSILWGNNISGGFVGSQIAISADSEYGQMPADVNVSYSDVQDGAANVFVDTAGGCILYWGVDANNLTGTSASKPEFVTGGLGGGCYLSQIAAGQTEDSNCLDKGDGGVNSLILGRYRYTTRTDNGSDFNEIDMGYHYYKSGKFTKGDITYDGGVDMLDVNVLNDHWLFECSFPGWCEGSDLNQDGIVNFIDQAILAALYGTGDIEAPVPNPSTWHSAPHSMGTDVIGMTATTAADNSGWLVYYYFECTTHADGNSNWQISPSYTAEGLATNDEYGFKVRVADHKLLSDPNYRDDPVYQDDPNTYLAEPGNLIDLDSLSGEEQLKIVTRWSHIGYAIAGEIIDVNSPEPDPMQWSVPPYALSSSSISMEAFTVIESGVQYFFGETTDNPGGNNSGWQDDTVYTDTGLDPNTLYEYRVKARDTSYNETGWSEPRSATTLLDIPPEPPVITSTAITAAEADTLYTYDVNASGSPVPTYSLTTAPSGMTIDPVTGLISWTPDVTQVGLNAVTVQAINSEGSDTQSFDTDVAEPSGCYDDGLAPAPNPYLDPNLSYMGYDDPVYFHHLESSIVEDVNGACEVEYFFQCYTNTGFNSSWQTSNVYQVDVSSYPANHYWRVKARDPFGYETPWSDFLMPD